jgi:hypothetical protein
MLEIIQKIIATLVADSTLTAIVPANNILYGPVDIVEWQQSGLNLPQINIYTPEESTRPVPTNARDTTIQLNIWSRNSMIEVVTVYERVIQLLNYITANQSTAHIFWSIQSGMNDQVETDRRIFHRSVIFKIWSVK